MREKLRRLERAKDDAFAASNSAQDRFVLALTELNRLKARLSRDYDVSSAEAVAELIEYLEGRAEAIPPQAEQWNAKAREARRIAEAYAELAQLEDERSACSEAAQQAGELFRRCKAHTEGRA